MPRSVYIDLGVAFGDTLDLYKMGLDARPRRSASTATWEVYGFEASPLKARYLDQLFQHLNGEGPRPVWCLPPVGSTTDRLRFAEMVGCERQIAMKSSYCMSKTFGTFFAEPALLREKVDPALIDEKVVTARLAEAKAPPALPAGGARYTFVPAAVGERRSVGRFERREMQIVDFTAWLTAHFTADDYVLVKMDIEGAEHRVARRLAAAGALPLIDRLAFECHNPPKRHEGETQCSSTRGSVSKGRVPPMGQRSPDGPFGIDAAGHKLLESVEIVPDRRIGRACAPMECYESFTEPYWRRRVKEFRQDLESPACAHVNVSLAHEAVAARLMRSGEPAAMARAQRLLAGQGGQTD